MERISSLAKGFLGSLGPEAEKMMRIQRIKERYRAAVLRTWRDNPDAARFVLMHTNGMYVARDERLRTGPDKHKERIVFGVYLDDPVVRTEFDARQSLLAFALRQEGMSFDEMRILPAKWDMRQRHAFPELWGDESTRPLSTPGVQAMGADDEAERLDALKRAFCLAFDDVDQAWAVLEKIEGAGFDEVRGGTDGHGSAGGRECFQAHRCHLYVEDVPAMKAVLAVHGGAVRSKARALGLRIRAFVVHQAPASLAGQCAFRRMGRSTPLRVHPSWATGLKDAQSSK